MRTYEPRRKAFTAAVLTLLLGLAARPAAAQCAPYICYLDLATGGFICPNASVYTVLQVHPTINTAYNPTCVLGQSKSAVVRIDLPIECLGVNAVVEYSGSPEGFSFVLGDSETNDGFGGDAGSVPVGQNAELQVLDNQVSVYNAAANPAELEQLAVSSLALRDGALNVVVRNQFVSFSQPYQSLSTPDLQRLFFLPPSPASPDNRTLYVGINRVIAPINGANVDRNGCGARRVIFSLR